MFFFFNGFQRLQQHAEEKKGTNTIFQVWSGIRSITIFFFLSQIATKKISVQNRRRNENKISLEHKRNKNTAGYRGIKLRYYCIILSWVSAVVRPHEECNNRSSIRRRMLCGGHVFVADENSVANRVNVFQSDNPSLSIIQPGPIIQSS